MTPEQTGLIHRIRALLADEPTVREVSMFGGISFMVNEKMIVAAGKDGSLLVRVDAERHEELLDRQGAAQAVMGTGRDMGPGWIRVTVDAISEDEPLASWIDVAMDYNRTVTASD